MPEVEFGVVPGWGTTADDRRALERLPNVRFLPNARNIDDVLARTRVLLMPSLWYEGFGLIVMESMLRGIPVVASDSGGLVEAKHGTGYVIPVHTIERYEPVFDEHAMPRPVVRENDAAPWVAALGELLGDRDAYQRESQRIARRRAALRRGTRCRRAWSATSSVAPRRCRPPGALHATIESLSPEKRALLLERAAQAERCRVMAVNATRTSPCEVFIAHSSGTEFALLSGARRRRQIQSPADGSPGRARARVPRRGAHQRLRRVRSTSTTWKTLAARGVTPQSTEDGVVTFERARRRSPRGHQRQPPRPLRRAVERRSRPTSSWPPPTIPAQLLLEVALRYAKARVVYLARATLAVPFGPDCAFPSEAKTERIRACDAVVGVSQYVADYIRKYAGIDAVHVPISLMEPEDWPELGRFDNEFVTLVNPCAVKGHLDLPGAGRRIPGNALSPPCRPGAPTSRIARRSRRGRTCACSPPVDDINLLLARTRVLLVPSLWAEARSRIVLEAMLRGVPVMAANVGGIPEAKMGVPYLLPVRPIEKYETRLDEQMVPVAQVPEQDIAPWREALARLLTDRAHYEEISRQSRAAALEYAKQLHAGHFEKILLGRRRNNPRALRRPRPRPVLRDAFSGEAQAAGPAPAQAGAPRRLVPRTPRHRRSRRLFWFPHAGGGAPANPPSTVRLERRARPSAGPRIARSPKRPSNGWRRWWPRWPTRSIPTSTGPSRSSDTAWARSIAFELARELRRRGRPLPEMLIASGARAPQFRRNHVPPPAPSREAFVEELRRLQGIPAEVLDDPRR